MSWTNTPRKLEMPSEKEKEKKGASEQNQQKDATGWTREALNGNRQHPMDSPTMFTRWPSAFDRPYPRCLSG